MAGQGLLDPLVRNQDTPYGEKRRLTIVVTGRAGVGKTILIQSLLQRLKTINRPKLTTGARKGVLEKYEGEIDGTFVTLYDTFGISSTGTFPSGSSSPRSSPSPDSPFKELRKEFGSSSSRNIDLLIYCEKMFSRFDQSSLGALKSFGSNLQEDAWERCIVALTQANQLPPTMKSREDQAERVKRVVEETKQQMQEHYFSKEELPKQSERMPFVPVGYIDESFDESAIPGSEDSIQDLIDQCIKLSKKLPRSRPGSVLAYEKGLCPCFLF